jgi:hypothetical protein
MVKKHDILEELQEKIIDYTFKQAVRSKKVLGFQNQLIDSPVDFQMANEE